MFYVYTFTYILELKNIRAAVTGSYQKSNILSLTMAVKKENKKAKMYFGTSPYLRLFAAEGECGVCSFSSFNGFLFPEFVSSPY